MTAFTWDVLDVQAITGQPFANANQLTAGQVSRYGDLDRVVLAGATYFVHGWARKTTSGGAVAFGLESTKPDGSDVQVNVYAVPTPVLNTWVEFNGSITVPTTHSKGRLIIQETGGGTVQIASLSCDPIVDTPRLARQSIITTGDIGGSTALGPVSGGTAVALASLSAIPVASGDVVMLVFTGRVVTTGALGATYNMIRIERYDNFLAAWGTVTFQRFLGADGTEIPVTITGFDYPVDTESGWAPSRDWRATLYAVGGAGNGNITVADRDLTFVRMKNSG